MPQAAKVLSPVNSRPTRLVIAATAGVVLALTACGGGSSPKPKASSALAGVKVSGADAKKTPAVTLPSKPFKVTSTQTQVLKAGTGATLTSSDIASLSMEVVNGTSGKTVNSNYEAAPTGLFVGEPSMLTGLKKGLSGQKVGSRLLLAIPPSEGFGAQGASQLGIGADDTMVLVLDVLSATKMLTEATGVAVPPVKGLPTVAFNDSKPATITVPKGAKAPTKLVVQPLVKGTGSVVKAGQTVRATYTGVVWNTGTMFDSAFSHDPKYFEFQAGAGGVIKAWDKAVVGQKVGSRLLLVVPPVDGYGAAGSPPKIKGTDTLVFVLDILGAY